jgi:hypothetical protein
MVPETFWSNDDRHTRALDCLKLWASHAARRRARIGSYCPPGSAIAGLASGLDERKPFHAQ